MTVTALADEVFENVGNLTTTFASRGLPMAAERIITATAELAGKSFGNDSHDFTPTADNVDRAPIRTL